MMTPDSPFEGLPRPVHGELTVYVLGPGFGESAVLCLPDNRIVAVDCCVAAGLNLPLALLQWLDRKQVDLLVITHPDLDHIAGAADLIRAFPPKHVWRYPFAAILRDLLARWLRQDPDEVRLKEVSAALQALDALQDANVAYEVGIGHRSWPSDAGAQYSISCIAPTPHDVRRVRSTLDGLVTFTGPDYELGGALQRYLKGERGLGDHPNWLSLALVVEWKGRKLLFAGDVESDTESALAGWRGILAILDQDGRGAMLRGVDVVKVAHHGSSNGFESLAWDRHSLPRGSTVCVIAPFKRGRVELPEYVVLQELRERAGRLAITSNEGSLALAANAGWARIHASSCTAAAAVVVVSCAPDGPIRVTAGAQGGVFEAPRFD